MGAIIWQKQTTTNTTGGASLMGSGTTSLAARNLERNSIGYEVNPEFIEIAKNKLNINQADIAGTTYEFLSDEINIDQEKEFENLPYRFVDYQKLDKKLDPKKLQFGSKIDKNSGQREEYYSVKEIISPELIKLNNDLVVRLIGVKEKKSANGSAKQFLYNKTKGQKVFMKFDNQKYDEQNHLMCYLYLKNKTFLNAHLIKEGLVEPNLNFDFKYKSKFATLK
jgi:site-specific DNA-methyltransferase (adenine-specific)